MTGLELKILEPSEISGFLFISLLSTLLKNEGVNNEKDTSYRRQPY